MTGGIILTMPLFSKDVLVTRYNFFGKISVSEITSNWRARHGRLYLAVHIRGASSGADGTAYSEDVSTISEDLGPHMTAECTLIRTISIGISQ